MVNSAAERRLEGEGLGGCKFWFGLMNGESVTNHQR